MLAMWAFLEGGTSSDSGGSGSIFLIVLVLVITAGTAAAVVSGKRREAFEAYMKEQHFRSTGESLPPTLPAPSNVWFPGLAMSDCYVGSRNDFEVAIFRMEFPQGEGKRTQTMVAVRRPPFGEVQLRGLLADIVKIDRTSTPGWVIASMKGNSRRPPVLEALLSALTARTAEEETPEKQLYDS